MTTTSTMPAQAEDERVVRETLCALYVAWANNDAEAFAALYLDDASVVMPGTYSKSSADVRAHMGAAFAGPLKGSRAIDEPQTIRFLSDDTAIVVSEGGIVMAGEATCPAERLRRATWVLAKCDERWLIASYHNCAAH